MVDSFPNEENGTAVSLPPKRERSLILEEEDRILEDSSKNAACADTPVIKTIAEKEQEHKHKIEEDKIKICFKLLVVCFSMIAIFAILDFFLDTPNESGLFSSAFEFAKTIATALVGYLFAAHSKDK